MRLAAPRRPLVACQGPPRRGGGRPTLSTSKQKDSSRLWVVVEGRNDAAAVRRAVKEEAQVYALGTASHARGGAALAAVRAWLGDASPEGLRVLLDPDVAGRQGRTLFHELEGCLHAFIPTRLATSTRATRWHEAGNAGVEHAQPEDIRFALRTARPFCAGRAEFSRGDLEALQLVVPFGQPAPSGPVGPAARRRLVCDYWGLGNCDGKQLLKQLNQYSFRRDELQEALRYALRVLEPEAKGGQCEEGPCQGESQPRSPPPQRR